MSIVCKIILLIVFLILFAMLYIIADCIDIKIQDDIDAIKCRYGKK